MTASKKAEMAQVAVVSGGTRGIGRSIAETLLDLGTTVIILGRNAEQVASAGRELAGADGICEGIACDVRNLDAIGAVATHVETHYGRLDILVNNAGVGGPSMPLHELEPSVWDVIFETNVRGPFLLLRALVPLMMETGGGHVINISSLAGKNPLPRGAAYAASKWALNGLSYSIAEELRPYNIRVTVICPGSVNTEFSPHTGKAPERMLQPEDVAHSVRMIVTQQPTSFMSEIVLRPTQKP